MNIKLVTEEMEEDILETLKSLSFDELKDIKRFLRNIKK